MTSITQQIPNYVGGISQQPDELKVPGQVRSAKNVLPDVTHGLLKRPGGRLIGNALSAYTTDSKWFHYYRDENEQYIGQIQLSSGEIKMWKCSDGTEYTQANNKITYQSGKETELKNYLKQTNSGGTITDSDIQTLTLNDYTYLTNRNKPVAMKTLASGENDLRPPEAYIELKKVAYASQYAVNLFDNEILESVTTATRIRIDLVKSSNNYCDANAGANNGNMVTHPNRITAAARCDDTAGDNRDAYAPNVGTRIFSITDGATLEDEGISNPGNPYSYPIDVKAGGPDGTGTTSVNRGKDLYFRVTTTGQSTPYATGSGESATTIYQARYTTTHDLLYGGEGWQQGDYFNFWLKDAYYKCTIEEISTSKVQANRGLIRPTPTSFDTKTTVTAESILGAIRTEIDNDDLSNFNTNAKDQNGALITEEHELYGNTNAAITAAGGTYTGVQQIGNGIYITRASGTFNITSPVGELLNVLSSSVEDVADLPKQCKHGYVVKVVNSEAEEDDYYVKFIGENGKDGNGVWEECPKPGVNTTIDPATMPVQLVRQADGTFKVSQVAWDNRLVGDTTTVPEPSFIKTSDGEPKSNSNTYVGTINKMLFFRNRMVLLSDENVIMSRPGDFFNFWPKSAITYTATDNIDISCSSEYPAIVYDGLQVNSGLVLFTKNQQFMLTTDSDVLSPLTAKINALASYNFNFNTNPISLGTSIAFLDNAGKYTRFFEVLSVLREGEPVVLEQSKNISKLFPNDIDLIANSRENATIFFATKGTNKLYGFRYYQTGERRVQQAWFEWELSGTIEHIAMLDDALYGIVENIVNDKSFTGNGSITSFDTGFDPMPALSKLNVQVDGIDKTSGFSLSGSSIVFTSAPANNSTIRVYEPRSVMQKFSLKLDDNSHTIVEDETYRVHLDNSKSFAYTNLTYVADGDYTKFDHTAANFGIDSSDIKTSKLYAVAVSTGTDKEFNGLVSKVTTFNDNGTTKVKIPGNWKTYDITAPKLHTDSATRAGNTVTITYTSHPFKVGDALQLIFEGSAITDTNYTVASIAEDGNSFTVTDPAANGTVDSAVDVEIKSTQTPATDIVIGYAFDMEVEFPTLYVTQQEGDLFKSDIQSSLVLHRIKMSLGPTGVYDTTLKRIGKPDYTETFESVMADAYTANTVGIDKEQVVTLPVYEKNTNLTFTLKSTHPTPSTLYSINWEGDYSKRYYKRV